MNLSELQTITANFVSELKLAQEGKPSSLSWLLHHLPDASLIKRGELAQVLVIGGSVCRKGLIRKVDGIVEILEHEKRDQPIFSSKEVFLKFIETEMLSDCRVLGINFAYPLDPVFRDGKLDGVFITGSKEHTFEGLVGKNVGKEIEEYIKEKTGRSVDVSVANDTICLLLSGLTLHSYQSLGCGIVGTGMNAAFFLDDKSFVNLESANFDKFDQSEEGKTIDKESVFQGKALLEKEVTGAYLYRHFNQYIKSHNLTIHPVNSTYELKKMALENNGEGSDIARMFIERSAALIACTIAGVAEFKKRDMIFVMDGSFFWEHDIYKNFVEEYVQKLTTYSVSFVQIEDTTLYGAAQLVC